MTAAHGIMPIFPLKKWLEAVRDEKTINLFGVIEPDGM
jgi:hypothetical protein